jgi:hypothetical protein
VTNVATVSGGGEINPTNNTASDPTSITQTINITVQTSPAGPAFTVDGTSYTGTQIFHFVPGSAHTIATTTPQIIGSTKYLFTSWSDGGAISHSITTPNAPTTYTANFTSQYQLTINVSPSGSGTVTPASGQFFAAGTVVSLHATANAGYSFANWTGNVANPNNPNTTITMNAPQIVTANFTAGATTILAVLIPTAFDRNAHTETWDVFVQNLGFGALNSLQITSITLTQTNGPACSPVITIPSTVPFVIGNFPPFGSAHSPLVVNFGSCAITTRFTLTVGLSANAGAVTATATQAVVTPPL